ncbi:dsRBD fold-containing protein [Kitasatospora sp. NPDC048540]|uniref:dsRBD fold-containing protein n=1 Tax=Kitasatospora sp. NPDC048540 TaxID=3155634 RepID=UPI0033F250EF
MTAGSAAAPEPHTADWQVRLTVTETGDHTRAHAVLDTGGPGGTGGTRLEADAEAHRSPHDPAAPVIGDELAAGRALLELGHRLVQAGSVAAEAAESARRRDGE